MEAYNLVSLAGIAVLVGIAWLFSAERKNLNWRVVLWGLGLQLVFALFIFVVPAGAKLFLALNGAVVKVLEASVAGNRFLFGNLAVPPGQDGSMGFFLAFQSLPSIVFFSALTALLYYFNVLPLVIRGFSWLFTRLMRVSGAESLCAASNIFVGIESALTVKPHLAEMTRSELCTVLTAGMSTVASNVLALYVFTLQGRFPTIAAHLISASILSAPAALVMAKILLPETGTPATLGMDVAPDYEKEASVFEAVINGANNGVKLIVGIAALLLAVLGLVALVNLVLGLAGGLSLERIAGVVCYPLALVIGVPPADACEVGRLIGERLILTEVPAYQHLAGLLESGALHHGRSAVIAAYALCGFAHAASMAIFIGGTAALAPGRVKDISGVGLRALAAATLACLLTACVAGAFYARGSILLGG